MLLRFLEASEVLLQETAKRNAEPTFMRYMPRRFMRWRKATGNLDKRINAVLSSGKSEGSRLNMLKALQDAHEGDKKMSKAELTDEILTLLIAGHETTGYTTSWALYEVACHPEVQEEDSRRSIGSRPGYPPPDECSEHASLLVDGLARSITLASNCHHDWSAGRG